MRNTTKIVSLVFFLILLAGCTLHSENKSDKNEETADIIATTENDKAEESVVEAKPTFVDEMEYDEMMMHMVNGDTTGLWPAPNDKYPLEGAILPFKRIVAYYGNMYSTRMGALGEYAPKEMWRMLKDEVAAWQAADPDTPVIPAVHYIAATAQGTPMKGNTYNMRMPHHQIDSALTIAKMEDAIMFLDIQVGHSPVLDETVALEKYLKMPHVHLGIDPEFSMKDGSVPGKRIGTFDADDINIVTDYLAELVRDNNLPPKILIVHRFTQGMVTNYKNIKIRPEVQIVMDMDGWGAPQLKYSTYERYIRKEPVQFTGFKIFYKNDLKRPPHRLLTPEEVMQLKPRPIYIQYQ